MSIFIKSYYDRQDPFSCIDDKQKKLIFSWCAVGEAVCIFVHKLFIFYGCISRIKSEDAELLI